MTTAAGRAGWTVRPAVFLVPLGVWLVLAVLAVANGAVRETFLVPRLGERRAHLLSTALLVTAILVVAGYYFTTTATDYGRAELALIGVGWTALTVGFEFLVGYAEGTPVSETVAQYDVFAGQVWILVPLTLLLSPLLFGWVLR